MIRAPMLLHAWDGLGDNIYLRPAVRALSISHELWLRTPWPELFEDCDVRFVRPDTPYRTQQKNVARKAAGQWQDPPRGLRPVTAYVQWSQPGVSITESIIQSLGLGDPAAATFDLPDFGRSPLSARPLAVIRPVVVRNEWRNESRNPLPEYIATATRMLRERGYMTVSVADTEESLEWIVPPDPGADLQLHQGELPIEQLLALVQHADVVVGGVGWIVPACAALGTPVVVVAGGNGAHNAPGRVVGPPMNADRMRWLMPDRYCLCDEQRHRCTKTISGFGEHFAHALDELTAAVPL